MKTCYVDKVTRSIADLCPPEDHNSGDGWLISRINVPLRARGQGHARAIFEKILTDADEEGVTLFLWICPSGGLNYVELEAWYTRHGFKYFGGVYKRLPQAMK